MIERPIYDEFVDRLAGYAAALKVGNGLDSETQMGPLINARKIERVAGYMDLGTQEGAGAAAGGSRLTGDDYDQGYFVSSTIFAGVGNPMRIAQEEIFGPVVRAIPFDAPEEAVRVADDTRHGLSGTVWTNSMQTGRRRSVRNGRNSGLWLFRRTAIAHCLPKQGHVRSRPSSAAEAFRHEPRIGKSSPVIRHS